MPAFCMDGTGTDSSYCSPWLLENRRFCPELDYRPSEAAEAGVYGSEFDVQLTADGVVVVNHDDVVEDW